MNDTLKNIIIAAIVAAIVSWFLVPPVHQAFGTIGAGITNYSGISIAGTPGSLTVTTSNSATSTTSLGCVQMYATSTATAVHLEFSTTTSLATYSGGAAPTGGVSWRYGVCPI